MNKKDWGKEQKQNNRKYYFQFFALPVEEFSKRNMSLMSLGQKPIKYKID